MPTIAPFAEDVPPAGNSGVERLPGFEDVQQTPRQYFAPPPPPMPPGPPPVIVAAPPPPAPASGTRAFLSRWLPEGIVPWNPTPDWKKDRGIGIPLKSFGWRTQPFATSGFAGATNGGPLIRGHVLQRPSFYTGVNFAWDYDHYWGFEKRLGFGALDLTNAQHQALETGWSVTGEYRLMWYPLGDSRWRPFVTAGIGWSNFYYEDDYHHHHLATLFSFPYGGGVKYLLNERLALRVDMIDELTFAGGPINTFHYVALVAGLEVRLGHKLLDWHKWFKKKCP
ncbi:MAG TPA: outer membrane beta-barrel protein [Pirellulales bacterium]